MNNSLEELNTALMATGGEHITNVALRRGLRLNVVAGSLGMAWWSIALGMPLLMFMEALGASGTMTGLSGSIMQAAVVMQIPGALLAERLSTRKVLWGSVIFAGRFIWFLPAILLALLPDRPGTIAAVMVALVGASCVLNASVSASWYSWLADLVPERIRGQFWGNRQSWVMASMMIVAIAAGYIMDTFPAPRFGGGSWFGFAVVFTMAAAFGTSDVIIHMGIPEPQPRHDRARIGIFRSLAAPLRQSDFRKLTFGMGFFTFAIGVLALSPVFLKKDFGVTYSELAALLVASGIGTILSGIVWGYVLDRIGGRALIVVICIFAPLVMSVWFFVKDYDCSLIGLFAGVPGFGPLIEGAASLMPRFLRDMLVNYELPQPIWLLLVVNLPAGLLYGAIGLCQMSMSAMFAPATQRTTAMAVHWSIVGLMGCCGPILAGIAMDYFASHPVGYTFPTGTRFAFHHAMVVVHVLVVWFVAVPILLRIRKGVKEPQIAAAFGMLAVNPVRVAANIFVMGSAVASERRARAVQSLGVKRISLVVADLIGKMNDSSAEVREEAVMALGSIGTGEAVEALCLKFKEPGSPLDLYVARALRRARAPESVDALLDKLDVAGPELRAECARALGEIGDPRAEARLLGLLGESNDPLEIVSIGHALSRFGKPAVAVGLVAAILRSSNVLVKESLALGVGDLVWGERDEIYRIVTREKRARGEEVARLLKDFRQDALNALPKGDAARSRLGDAADRLQRLYDDGEYNACLDVLHNMAADIAGDSRERVVGGKRRGKDTEETALRDERLAVGKACLGMLREGASGWIEALLGIYIVSRALSRDS